MEKRHQTFPPHSRLRWYMYLSRSAQNSADLKQLVDLVATGKEWAEGIHLCCYGSHCPHVYWGVVVCGAKEDLWSAVPGMG